MFRLIYNPVRLSLFRCRRERFVLCNGPFNAGSATPGSDDFGLPRVGNSFARGILFPHGISSISDIDRSATTSKDVSAGIYWGKPRHFLRHNADRGGRYITSINFRFATFNIGSAHPMSQVTYHKRRKVSNKLKSI